MNLGVAYSAHVGGFAFGLAAALALKVSGIERRRLLPATAAGTEWKEDPEYLQALEQHRGQGPRRRGGAGCRRCCAASPATRARSSSWPASRCTHGRTDAWRGQAVSAYVVELAPARLSEVLPLTKELRLLEQPFAARAIGPPPCVVRAAAAADEARADGQGRHPAASRSTPAAPWPPGVMWDVARLQERLGRQDLARGTLPQLVARYPDDPFAEQARRKLEP